MGRYQEALSSYRKYIQIAPSDQERGRGLYSVAIVNVQRGDLGQAERAARKELMFSKKRTYNWPLAIALARGDALLAEKLQQQRLSGAFVERGGRSNLRFAHYFDGQLALQKGRDQEALENFQAALRQLPPTWNLDSYEDCLANAYLKLGLLDQAIGEYERILGLNPNYPFAHYHLAEVYEQKGQHDKAHAEYERFLQVWKDADPDIPEVISAKKRLALYIGQQ